MKTQNEMRSEFEKLEEVKNRLSQGGVYWDGKKYSTLPFMSSFVSTAIFLNGAWYAFQEKQKILVDFINQNKFEPVETWIVGDVINVDKLLELLK